MAEIERLRLIQGGAQKRKYAAKRPKSIEQWVCRICEAEIKIATSAIIKVKQSPMIEGVKIKGGTDMWVCAHCLVRGIINQVI